LDLFFWVFPKSTDCTAEAIPVTNICKFLIFTGWYPEALTSANAPTRGHIYKAFIYREYPHWIYFFESSQGPQIVLQKQFLLLTFATFYFHRMVPRRSYQCKCICQGTCLYGIYIKRVPTLDLFFWVFPRSTDCTAEAIPVTNICKFLIFTGWYPEALTSANASTREHIYKAFI